MRRPVGARAVERGPTSRSALQVTVATPLRTRDAAMPGYGIPHLTKLRGIGAPDVRDGNAKVERLPGGYLRVTARDDTRRHG